MIGNGTNFGTLRRRFALLSLSSIVALGCGPATGTGSLVITASGEEAAEVGFPVEADGELLEFADGWSVRFDKYLAAIGRVRIATGDTTVPSNDRVGASPEDVVVFDLVQGEAELFRFDDLEARRWDQVSFAIVAPSASARIAGNVSDDDLARMTEDGFSYWIEGTATKGARTVTFAWGLRNPVELSGCTDGNDERPGVVVRRNSTTEAEITFHLEHLFWTSLGAEAEALRFDAIAAVADEDGFVSLESLEAQVLTDLRDENGEPLEDENGAPIVYDPGQVPFASNPPNLAEFLHHTTAAQAHLNGSGLCSVTAL